jgi:predicted ATPase
MLLVSLRSEALRPMTRPQPDGSAASGPTGLIRWLANMEREIAPVYLELEPLGEPETVQMVLSILEPPAADFAQWLYAETRGHPFYLMETLKDLLERRVLRSRRRVGGQWVFAMDAEHDLGQAVRVPSTVHAVIRSRLQRLSPNAFSLLVGAAVLEQQITFERLCAIANVPEDQALPALDELLTGRLLMEAAQASAASDYAFINDMARDVVYTEAGDARRRLFHRRALEILAASGEPAPALAYHAQAAGLSKDVFDHSLAAGREALRIAAANEAIVHLERARGLAQELMTDVSDKANLRDLYLWLSQAYKRTGQMEKASAVERELDRERDL